MSVDAKVYDFAKLWLACAGYTYSEDIKRLAEQLQDCCEDYVTDIENGPQT